MSEEIKDVLKKIADPTQPRLTPSELMLATTVRDCSDCGKSHAPVRACDGSMVVSA